MKEEDLDKILEEDNKEKEVSKQLKIDLENLLKTDSGIRFFKSLIFTKCFVDSSAYTNDIYATNFNLGRQSVGQELLNEIKSINKEFITKIINAEINAEIEKNEKEN